MAKDKKLVALLLTLLYFILMTVPAQAWTVYDVGSQPLKRKNVGNYDNWPYDIRRQCVIEQSRAVLECSKSGFQNWVVFQTIAGKGTYKNKNVSMFYEGYISGNYDCDPPETREENGFLVDDLIHINSRIIYKEVKSVGKNNSVQYSHFTCHFLCQAWNCAGKSLKEKLAEERLDLKKEKIFCIKSIFSEGITPQEKKFLKEGLISDDEKKKLETRQRAAEWKVTRWWWGWYKLLEELCKDKDRDCEFLQIYQKETRLKELVPDEEFWGYYEEAYAGEKLVEYCWYCNCWNLKQFPKTTLREKDLERAKKLLEKYEKYDILQTKTRETIEKKIYVTPQGERKTAELRERFGDTYILLDGDGTPIGVYLSVGAEELCDEEVSPSGGYLVEPTWDFRRGYRLTGLPKLKPSPKETAIPGYSPVEDERPPQRGISYRTSGKRGGELVEEDSVTLVPVGEEYVPCEEYSPIEETSCPPPREGLYLAGYHEYEHLPDGTAKGVGGFGATVPSEEGYEELIFGDRHTIACIYEPVKILEGYVPRLGKEDCPEPEHGFSFVGFSWVVNHELVESWGKTEVGGERYTYVKSRTVVRDCVPVVDEVLTCFYESFVEFPGVGMVPLDEAIDEGWIRLEGLGTVFGDIFRVTPTPGAPPGITVELGPITHLKPEERFEEDYQGMVTSNLEPRELVFHSPAVIRGYCLDAFKEPPGPQIDYRVGELEDRERIRRIIGAGEDLYLVGEFDQDYMPPKEYKEFVVQQAIWVYTTRGTPQELGREDIRENLFAIMGMIETRTGKIIPEGAKNSFAEKVWEDIQKTLQKATLG
ncbi:MAG: hypothetical protein DRO11_03050 [Methanobacteriota archaeon]|nr:MAG: hypothetical protein DRO11_03050 [Euryarchaeota archaeon]